MTLRHELDEPPQLISAPVMGLAIQGAPIRIDLLVARWRRRNESCMEAIFAERLSDLAGVHA